MAFDDHKYTEDAIIKQLSLIQLHVDDGSALDAGCGCIEGKHTFNLEGLSEEQTGFALSESEKKFYERLAKIARTQRHKIEQEEWDEHGDDSECVHCENLRGHERKECFKLCSH